MQVRTSMSGPLLIFLLSQFYSKVASEGVWIWKKIGKIDDSAWN